MTAHERERYYEDYWRDERVGDSPHQRWKIAALREIVARRSPTAVLDVGAGDGALLAAAIPQGARRVGAELADDALSKLRARGIEGVKVDLEQGRLPFDDGVFDVTTCLDVLEHLFAPDPLLAEITRVTAARGVVILAVPNAFNLANRVFYALGKHVDVMDVAHRTAAPFSEHIRFFSEATLADLCRRAGLRVVERRYYFPDELSDVPRAKWAAKLITAPRLHERVPSLFALGFLVVCEKR